MDWEPIETAPKDRTIILYRPHARLWATISTGRWTADEYNKNPRPYWKMDKIGVTINQIRRWKPTHWMPLPVPPEDVL